MKIKELIKELKKISKKYGNIEVAIHTNSSATWAEHDYEEFDFDLILDHQDKDEPKELIIYP